MTHKNDFHIDPYSLGFSVFDISKIFETGEVLVRCPYHNDTNPSASFNAVKGAFICYACGESKTAYEIADDLGGNIIPFSQAEYSKPKQMQHPGQAYWEELEKTIVGGYCDYLEQRGISEETAKAFGIACTNTSVIFPFWDLNFNQMFGFQLRMFPGYDKYRKYLRYSTTKSYVYPYSHDISMSVSTGNPVFVTEGVFGTLRAYESGYKSIALLGSSSAKKYVVNQYALNWDIQPLYFYLDNDNAGIASMLYYFIVLPSANFIFHRKAPDDLGNKGWDNIFDSTLDNYFRKNGIVFRDSKIAVLANMLTFTRDRVYNIIKSAQAMRATLENIRRSRYEV